MSRRMSWPPRRRAALSRGSSGACRLWRTPVPRRWRWRWRCNAGGGQPDPLASCALRPTRGRVQVGASMPGSVRRLALGIVLAVVSVSAAVVGSEPAHADLVTSGQVTFSGEQANGLMLGDHAYSYSTSQGVGIDAALRTDWPLDPLVVYSRDSSDYWDVEFAAPPGQQLTVGTYTGAV